MVYSWKRGGTFQCVCTALAQRATRELERQYSSLYWCGIAEQDAIFISVYGVTSVLGSVGFCWEASSNDGIIY